MEEGSCKARGNTTETPAAVAVAAGLRLPGSMPFVFCTSIAINPLSTPYRCNHAGAGTAAASAAGTAPAAAAGALVPAAAAAPAAPTQPQVKLAMTRPKRRKHPGCTERLLHVASLRFTRSDFARSSSTTALLNTLRLFRFTRKMFVPLNYQMPVSLKGKNIEEIINEWNGELEEQVAAFNKHAGGWRAGRWGCWSEAAGLP